MVVTGLRFLLTGQVGLHRFRPTRQERVLGVLATLGFFLLFFGLPCLVREPWIVTTALLGLVGDLRHDPRAHLPGRALHRRGELPAP